jgi:hypothetical protein
LNFIEGQSFSHPRNSLEYKLPTRIVPIPKQLQEAWALPIL